MAYGYGNSQNNGRRMTLQERLDAMRKTAIQGHYGFSQDDTPKERLKKRLKALRDGYGTIPQSSWTNRQEQQEQDTTSPSMQFDPQYNEAAPKGAGTTTNRTGAGTGAERRFDPLHNTPAAAGGQDGTSRPGSVTPTTVETTPTSTRQQDNRTLEQRWLDMIADQRREREEAAEAGEARPVQSYTVREDSPLSRIIAEVTGTTPSTAQAEDYQGELDRIATIMPMIDRLEKAVRTGALSPDQQRELDEARAALSPYLPDLAQTNSADELHNNLEYLARQRQDIQNRQNLGTLLQNQDAMGAYEKKDEFTQDLTDLNYMISDLVNGGRADSDRYKELKEKYSLSDSMLAGYVRAMQTGIEEEDWTEAGLTGWESVANLKNHLQDNINRYSERMAEAGVDPDQLEEYITRTAKEQEVLDQAESDRLYMQENPLNWLFGSAVSVFSNIGSSLEALNMYIRNRDNNDPMSEDYRPYSVADLPNTIYTQALREGGGEAVANTFDTVKALLGGEDTEDVRWLGNFLYNTGMSIADSATVMAAAAAAAGVAGLPMAAAEAMTLFTMGGTAASNAAVDVIQRGGSNQQIMQESLASGVFEAFFEKFSVDRIFKMGHAGTVKAWVKETLKQAGIEASEEMATETANIIADAIIMTDKSDFEMAVQQYRSDFINNEGYSYDEADQAARAAAIVDMVRRVGEAGLGGAISGAVMGGVHNAQGYTYSHAVLENASNGIPVTAEDREFITRNVQDGEGLLREADQRLQEYRQRRAAEIAARNAQNAQDGQGGTDTLPDGQNGSTDEQGPRNQENRLSLRQRLQAMRQQRQDSKYAARDMRTYNEDEGTQGRGVLQVGDYKLMNDLARASKTNINLINSTENSDVLGYYKDGEVYITENALRNGYAAYTTAFHEVTHSLKETAPEQYNRLVEAAAAMYGSREAMVQTLQQAAAQSGVQLTEEDALDEGVAVLAERMAYSPRMFEAVARANANIAQNLLYSLRDQVGNLVGKIAHIETTKAQEVVKNWGEALKAANRQTRVVGRTDTRESQANSKDTTEPTAPALENDQGLRAGPEAETETETQQAEAETATEETGEEQTAPENVEGQTQEDGRTVEDLQRMIEEQRQNPTMSAEELVDLANELAQKMQQQQQNAEESQDETVEAMPILEGDGLTAGPAAEEREQSTTEAEEDQERQEEERQRAAEQARQEQLRQQRWNRRQNETRAQWLQRLQQDKLRGDLTQEEFERGLNDFVRSRRDSVMAGLQESLPALRNEDGLQAGETEENGRRAEMMDQIQDLLKNDTTLRNLAEMQRQGVLTDAQYANLRNAALRANDRYQALTRELNGTQEQTEEQAQEPAEAQEEEETTEEELPRLLPQEMVEAQEQQQEEAEPAQEEEQQEQEPEEQTQEQQTEETETPKTVAQAAQAVSQREQRAEEDSWEIDTLEEDRKEGVVSEEQYQQDKAMLLEQDPEFREALHDLAVARESDNGNDGTLFKLQSVAEEVGNLIAVHNLSVDQALWAIQQGGIPMPSIAVVRAQTGHEKYGDVSIVFDRNSIDPIRDSRNHLYGGDAWTPTAPQMMREIDQGRMGSLNAELNDSVREYAGGIFEDRAHIGGFTEGDEVTGYSQEDLARRYARNDAVKIAYLAENGIELSRDYTGSEASQALQEVEDLAADEDVQEWMQGKLNGVLGRQLIRNGKDTFTRTGNRRAVNQLYEEPTLENILNAMEQQKQKGQNATPTANGIMALATRNYRSVAEMQQDQGRLARMSDEEYGQILDGLNEEMDTIQQDVLGGVAPYYQTVRFREALMEAAGTKQTAQAVQRAFSENGITLNQDQVKAVRNLFKRMQGTATEYFEAKPDRITGTKEWRLMVVPESAAELVDTARQAGIQVETYKDGDSQDRLRALNSRQDTLFRRESVSNAAEVALEYQQQLEQENRELEKANQRLYKWMNYYADQWKVTNRQQPDPAKVRKFVQGELEYFGSQAYIDSVMEKVTAAYNRMATLDPTQVDITQDQQVNDMLQEAAEEIVRNAYEDLTAEYADDPVVDFIRTSEIDITGLEGEIKSRYDSMKEFRRATRGLIKIAKKSDSKFAPSPAGLVQSIESSFGGMRITEQDSEAGCLFALIDYVERMTAENWVRSFDEETIQVESAALAAKLKETFFTLPKVKETRMDKVQQQQQKKLDQLEKRHQKEIARMNQEKERFDEMVKQKLARERSRAEQQRRLLNERYAARDAMRRERATERDLQDRILKHSMALGRKLVNPTDKQHIPDTLREPVLQLLESLDLEDNYGYLDGTRKRQSSYAYIMERDENGKLKVRAVRNDEVLPTKRSQRAIALRDALSNLEKSGSSTSIDPELADKLSQIAQIENKNVANFSRDELQLLWDTIRSVEKAVSDYGKMLGQSRYATVKDAAIQIIKAANQDYSKKDLTRKDKLNYVQPIGFFDDLFQIEQLTPETYFHRLGPAGDDLFSQMRRAQENQVRILQEGIAAYKNALKEAGITEETVRAWEKDQEAEGHTFTFETDEGTRAIKLSSGQIMELYLLSKREQAIDHITIGGIASATGEVWDRSHGIPVKVKNSQSTAIQIGADGIQTITKGLTDKQKAFANALQSYLSGTLAMHGNAASVEVYGYSKFTEKNYWPITTKGETNALNWKEGREAGDNGGANMISSYGMAKSLVKNASNAVVLNNVTDTFTRNLDQMATYSAWLATSENLKKIYNYRMQEDAAEGRKRVNTTTQEALKAIMGEKGAKYWSNLVYDIAIGTKAGSEKGITEKGLNAFKAAAVGANIRVILQQPTAIIRAAEMLNPKYLTKVKNPFQAFERAKQHSGIAQWKDWGYFELDTGRNLRELMLGEDSKLEKAKNEMMAGAGMADNFAWGILWNGVEAETRDLHPDVLEGSREFYEICAKRFGDIIDRTQVVDSVLHRSQLMRSTNGLNKLATSFMSEPTKVYNMVVRDLYDIGEAIRTGKPEAVKAAWAHVGRTAAALVISFAVNGIARAIPDFLRSDDRDKDEETFINEWWENFASDFNPLSYVPYLRDVWSVIQGFTVERSDMQGLADLTQAAKQLMKAVSGDGRLSVFNAGQALARKAASALGIPVDNLARDLTAIFNTCLWSSGNYVLTYKLDKFMLNWDNKSNRAVFSDTLYRAMMNDEDQYEEIYDDMVDNDMDPDDIKEAMELRMWKEAQLLWKDEEDVTNAGSSLLPVDWQPPGDSEEWDDFMDDARDEDNWAELFDDDYWEVVQDLEDGPSGRSKEATAEKRRIIADQPYAEDIKETAMETILSGGAFRKYMVAREAGVSTFDYVDLIEEMEEEAEKAMKKEGKQTANITMEIVEKVLKKSKLKKKQKAAIWKSYSSAKNPVSHWG